MQVILVVTMYSDRYVISLFPNLHRPFPPFSPSLISLMVSVDVKHHVYLLTVRPCFYTVDFTPLFYNST